MPPCGRWLALLLGLLDPQLASHEHSVAMTLLAICQRLDEGCNGAFGGCMLKLGHCRFSMELQRQDERLLYTMPGIAYDISIPVSLNNTSRFCV